MRYIFETFQNNGKYNIKITLQTNNYTSQSFSAEQSIYSLDSDPDKYKASNNAQTDIESIVNKILDNIRLTVAERNDAIKDVERFIKYIKSDKSNEITDDDMKLINEIISDEVKDSNGEIKYTPLNE